MQGVSNRRHFGDFAPGRGCSASRVAQWVPKLDGANTAQKRSVSRTQTGSCVVEGDSRKQA